MLATIHRHVTSLHLNPPSGADEAARLLLDASERVPVGGVLEVAATTAPLQRAVGILSERGFGCHERRDHSRNVVRWVRLDITRHSTVSDVADRYPNTLPVFRAFGMDRARDRAKSINEVAEHRRVSVSSVLVDLQKAAMPHDCTASEF